MPDLAAGAGITFSVDHSTDVLRISTNVVSGRLLAATYAALAAITDRAEGTPAEVPTSDAGTHTDPVVGGTVNNSGVFRWSASPAGWQRIADVDAVSAAPYAAAAAASETAAAASETAAAESLAELKVNAPFPQLPAAQLHWTPLTVQADSDGQIVRINCIEGDLRLESDQFVPAGSTFTVNPAPFVGNDLNTVVFNGDGVTTTFSLASLVFTDDKLVRGYVGIASQSSAVVNVAAKTITFASPPAVGTGNVSATALNRHQRPYRPNKRDDKVMWGVFGMGQSWMYGPNDASPLTDALETTAVYSGKVLMPENGVRIGDALTNQPDLARRFNAMVDLVETSAAGAQILGATPISGLCNHWMRDLDYYFPGHSMKIFGCCVANSGNMLEELGRGSATFEGQFVPAVTDFVRVARAMGYRPYINAVPFVHGQANDENDTSTAQYMQMVRSLRDAVREVVRHYLPWQEFEPTLVMDQLRSASNNTNAMNAIAQAQFLLSYEQGFASCGEEYTTPQASPTAAHPSQRGYDLIGQRLSWAMENCYPAGLGWSPLRPDFSRGTRGIVWQAANQFDIFYQLPRDTGSLRLDVTGTDILVGGACTGVRTAGADDAHATKITGNGGFDYWDNSGSPPAVSTVEIVAFDRVRITLASTPTGYERKVLCAARKDSAIAGNTALLGGGRSCLYLDDADTRWHTSIYPDPVNEGGDGVTPHNNKLWTVRYDLPLPL